jgi:hypothetical protein
MRHSPVKVFEPIELVGRIDLSTSIQPTRCIHAVPTVTQPTGGRRASRCLRGRLSLTICPPDAGCVGMAWRNLMARGILVFLVILLLGGGVFWALVGGCVAS